MKRILFFAFALLFSPQTFSAQQHNKSLYKSWMIPTAIIGSVIGYNTVQAVRKNAQYKKLKKKQADDIQKEQESITIISTTFNPDTNELWEKKNQLKEIRDKAHLLIRPDYNNPDRHKTTKRFIPFSDTTEDLKEYAEKDSLPSYPGFRHDMRELHEKCGELDKEYRRSQYPDFFGDIRKFCTSYQAFEPYDQSRPEFHAFQAYSGKITKERLSYSMKISGAVNREETEINEQQEKIKQERDSRIEPHTKNIKDMQSKEHALQSKSKRHILYAACAGVAGVALGCRLLFSAKRKT